VTARVSAGPGAKLHWLPQETILFDRASLTRRLEADLDQSSEFIAVEAVLLGRQAMGEAMTHGLFRDRWRIRHGGFPYHLALLQLEHDSSFQKHSPFSTMTEFLSEIIEGFASGAPRHHHLVVKAHPLEDGRVPLRREVRRLARQHGIAERVHYVRGGKLAQLLNEARSAVTINSTAGQQVLWRGIPLKVFGRAVYAKPEFVSDQRLRDFFAGATRPDNRAYKDYRRFLLETSQVPGGFYSARGRRQLLRHVVDMMLSHEDPYEALKSGTAAPRQQLRVVT